MPAGGYPAIVALHGCSGMYSSLKGREDRLSERLMARADMLLGEGYAVLFPDSFGAAAATRCARSRSGERSISRGEAPLDALGALAYPRGAARHRARPHRARRLVARRQHDAGRRSTRATATSSRFAIAPARRRSSARRWRSIRAAARRSTPASAGAGRAHAHPHRRARRLDAGEAVRRARRGDAPRAASRSR